MEEKRWARRNQPFKQLESSDISDFPVYDETELIIFFTSTYQLKQTISYLAEMLGEDNKLKVSFLKDSDERVIKLEVPSRHISRKIYRCFIKYDSDRILGHACTCANALRTIGCCSHVAAVIYYFDHGRYLSKILKPNAILTKLIEKDSIEPKIDDSDEDF